MKVEAIMTRNPVTVSSSADLDQALELMDEHDVRHLPVLTEGALAGVISDRQVFEATGCLHLRQREVLDAPEGNVGQFMRAPAATVELREPIGTVLEQFVQGRIGYVPVLEEEHMVGVVTEIDVLRSYVNARRRGEIGPESDAPIEEHMTRDPVTITGDESGSEAAELMREKGVRHLPVMDGDVLVGMVSDRDIRIQRGRGALELTLVSELMSPEPETAQHDQLISSVALMMTSERISALPVLEGARLVGIATTIDVMGACASALKNA